MRGSTARLSLQERKLYIACCRVALFGSRRAMIHRSTLSLIDGLAVPQPTTLPAQALRSLHPLGGFLPGADVT